MADGSFPSTPHAHRKPWTTRECAKLREVYPTSIADAVAALPGRTRAAILVKARALGVRSNYRPNRPTYYKTPPDAARDQTIRQLFESAPTRRQIIDCAERLGLNEGRIRRRAAALGVIIPRLAAAPWSEDEDELLASLGDLTPHSIARRFRQCGYRRSPAAIASRMSLNGMHRAESRRLLDKLSVPEVAAGLNMCQAAVTRWCRTKLLNANVRDSGGDSVKAYDITPAALIKFMGDHPERFQLRKINQDWFCRVILARALVSQEK